MNWYGSRSMSDHMCFRIIIRLKSIFYQRLSNVFITRSAVSHIQDFGDAAASSPGDAVFPTGDAATHVGDVHLPA